ncbi:MAG: hypothetical protein RLZZ123_1967, partial [Pseudomonadota bacterium]
DPVYRLRLHIALLGQQAVQGPYPHLHRVQVRVLVVMVMTMMMIMGVAVVCRRM